MCLSPRSLRDEENVDNVVNNYDGVIIRNVADNSLRLIDARLKGTEEYEECNNDPKKVLSVLFDVKSGNTPKRIPKDVLRNLEQKVNALFPRLSRLRKLTAQTPYAHKKAVAMAFHVKSMPKRKPRIGNDVVTYLTDKIRSLEGRP